MKNNKKTIIITSIILGVLILTISLTYAVFSMSKTGQNSNLVVGDVYMHYANGSKSINLTSAMPSETYDATSFFEFTIDGKNTTTNKDIWYEIILKHGDDVTGKTRIKDNLLKFTLTETKNGTTTTVFDGRSYGDLTNKRIWVNTISKNTTSEVNITYRLYMWISNNTVIGNTEDVDYTTEEWKNIFASIKVDVVGDFNEKKLTTDESCFETNTTKIYELNTNMTAEELNKCMTYVTNLGTPAKEGETIEAFCKGTGTLQDLTFQSVLDGDKFNSSQLSYFETNNIIISTIGVLITNYDSTCGSDVIIPNKINNYKVIGTSYCEASPISNNINVVLGNLNYYTNKKYELKNTGNNGCGFKNKNLTSIVFPEGMLGVGGYSFSNNKLINVTIPDSVTFIGEAAFQSNQLTSVTFASPSMLDKIKRYAFVDNSITSVTIPNSVTYLSCDSFDSTVSITKNDNLICDGGIY